MKSELMRNGFTLVEVSIVLVIVGLVTGAAAQEAGVLYKLYLLNQQTQNLTAIHTAISTYVTANGHLPCPANPALPQTDANFGVGAACDGTDAAPPLRTAGARTINGNPVSVRVGALPVRDLGLANSYAINPWGYRLAYAVTEALAQSATYNTANGAIDMVDGNSVTVMPGRVSGTALYALVDPGVDGIGAYSGDAGVLHGACPANSPGAPNWLEADNCNGGSTFRTMPLGYASGANYFDDIAQYRINVPAPPSAGPPCIKMFPTNAGVITTTVPLGVTSIGYTLIGGGGGGGGSGNYADSYYEGGGGGGGSTAIVDTANGGAVLALANGGDGGGANSGGTGVGANGTAGAVASGSVAVTPGDTLTITLGGGGGGGGSAGSWIGAPGGGGSGYMGGGGGGVVYNNGSNIATAGGRGGSNTAGGGGSDGGNNGGSGSGGNGYALAGNSGPGLGGSSYNGGAGGTPMLELNGNPGPGGGGGGGGYGSSGGNGGGAGSYSQYDGVGCGCYPATTGNPGNPGTTTGPANGVNIGGGSGGIGGIFASGYSGGGGGGGGSGGSAIITYSGAECTM